MAGLKPGFLEDVTPPKPIEADALEHFFTAGLKEAGRLREIVNDEETPFASRYEERHVLQGIIRQAEANAAAEAEGSAAARRARVIAALANGLLGRNFVDTEEPSQGQKPLEESIEVLADAEDEAIPYIDALNNLGTLWANRGEFEKSLSYLERSRDAQTKAAAFAKAEAEAAEVAGKELAASAPGHADNRQRLEDQKTLTTFFLAQAYGHFGRRAESAAHCHETMTRQLARHAIRGGGEFAFNPQEWTRNACDLSKYYCSVRRFELAEHCLHAAEVVIAADRKKASAARAKAKAEKEAAAKEAARAEAAERSGAVDVSDPEGGAAAGEALEVSSLQREAKELGAELASAHDKLRELGDTPEAGAAGSGAAAEEAAKPKDNRIFLNSSAAETAEYDAKVAARKAAAGESAEAAKPAGWGDRTEDEAEAAASVDIAWADLWLKVLKRAMWLRIETAGGEVDNEGVEEGLAIGPAEPLYFTQLKLPPASAATLEPKSARGYTEARAVFKRGMAYATRAKAVFVLDGFVTQHFEIIEREVDYYGTLITWEQDPARRHAMHKRRLALLQPPLSELNPSAYRQLVRQGLFDVGSITAEMLEVKSAMHANEPAAAKARKLAQPVQLCVESYAEFLEAFDGKMSPELGLAPAHDRDRVEESQEQAYLTAHFHIARARGKLESVDSLTAALREYEFIAAYITKHGVSGMEEEAHSCREMASLLPRKISQLAAHG